MREGTGSASEGQLAHSCPTLAPPHLAHTGHTGHTVAVAALSEAVGALVCGPLREEVVNLVIITHSTGLALPYQDGEHKLSICGVGSSSGP